MKSNVTHGRSQTGDHGTLDIKMQPMGRRCYTELCSPNGTIYIHTDAHTHKCINIFPIKRILLQFLSNNL